MRAKLAPSLEASPSTKPSDPALLDQYEQLIEQTLLAGRVQEAFELSGTGWVPIANLGWVTGEFGRGLRILERFVPADDFSVIEHHLHQRRRSRIANALGLFAAKLGDLDRARRAFAYSHDLSHRSSDPREGSIWLQNLADVELNAGHFPQALKYSEAALSLAAEASDEFQTEDSLVLRALANFCLGNIDTADFERAARFRGQRIYTTYGINEAECKHLSGDRSGARNQTQVNLEFAVRKSYVATICRCNALLARFFLPDDPARSGRHLQEARAFANRSGVAELQLRCFHAASELELHLGDFPQAVAEAEAGILLADTCSFGKYSIDLRLALAETLLVAGDAHKALQSARDALDRSEHTDCTYAWGQADGLHFCGLAHLRLGEHELARQRLTAALELRERLSHGRIEETRRALDLCRL